MKVFLLACKNRYWYVDIANIREKYFKSSVHLKTSILSKEDTLIVSATSVKPSSVHIQCQEELMFTIWGIAFASMSNSASQYGSLAFQIRFEFISFVQPLKNNILNNSLFAKMIVECLFFNYLNLMMARLTFISKRYYFVLNV